MTSAGRCKALLEALYLSEGMPTEFLRGFLPERPAAWAAKLEGLGADRDQGGERAVARAPSWPSSTSPPAARP